MGTWPSQQTSQPGPATRKQREHVCLLLHRLLWFRSIKRVHIQIGRFLFSSVCAVLHHPNERTKPTVLLTFPRGMSSYHISYGSFSRRHSGKYCRWLYLPYNCLMHMEKSMHNVLSLRDFDSFQVKLQKHTYSPSFSSHCSFDYTECLHVFTHVLSQLFVTVNYDVRTWNH
jgi:hypothetical protein